MKSNYHQNIHIMDLFPGKQEIQIIANQLRNQNCVIIKNFLDHEYCNNVISYLSNVRLNSLPRYEPMRTSSPNNYRLNHEDQRSNVQGFFEQFNFFNHNQDLMHIFIRLNKIFELKDSLSYELADKKTFFRSMNPPENFISRVGFQFYPSERGYLEEHSDYVGENQYVVPTLVLSKRGRDYFDGGFYYKTKTNHIVDPEPFLDIGDIILFDPRLPHGVSRVKKHGHYDWRSAEGRWMAFATTTKTT